MMIINVKENISLHSPCQKLAHVQSIYRQPSETLVDKDDTR
jgi:hypothetical protein